MTACGRVLLSACWAAVLMLTGTGCASDEAASPAWTTLAKADTFYVALGDSGNLITAFITPAGHYCVDNRASASDYLADLGDPSTVKDPKALFSELAGSRESSWTISGKRCTGFSDNGSLTETTFNHEGVIAGGSTTGTTFQLQIQPTADGMTITYLNTGKVRTFMAVKRR